MISSNAWQTSTRAGGGSERAAELGLTHDDENVETFMIRNVMR